MAQYWHVKTRIKNRWTSVEWPMPPELSDYFSWRLPNHRFTPAGRNGWDGYISLMDGNRIPTGLFLVRKALIEQETNIRFDITDKRTRLTFTHPVPTQIGKFTVRVDQREALREMRRHCDTGGLLLNATGTGKTALAGFFIHMLDAAHKVIFVNDELSLVDQTREELAGILGERIGLVGDSVFSPERVTCATIQTLHAHRVNPQFQAWVSGVDVFFLDEVHDCLNKRTEETMKLANPKCVFGLTGSLNMKDPNVRSRVFALAGPKLYQYSYEQGREDAVLAKGVAIGLDSVRSIPVNPETYLADYREFIVEDRGRNRLICQAAREALKRGYCTVILVDRVDHVKRLSKLLKDIPHFTVFGEKDTEQRRFAKKSMEAGRVNLLIANKVFKKGVNIRRISCIVEAASMKRDNDTIQKFGRGTRTVEGKAGLIYLDIGDRAPKGGKNRFEKATKARRAALAKLGVPVWAAQPEDSMADVFDKAEALLNPSYTTRRRKA